MNPAMSAATRRLVSLCILVAAIPASAGAQVSIGVFEDPTGFDCHASAPGAGVHTYYVVARHRHAGGITAVRFSVPVPPCLGAAWLGESSPFDLVAGDSQDGVTIAFGACITAESVLLLSVDVLHAAGAGANCCYFPVLPYPAEPSGSPVYVSCALEELPALGRSAWLNDDGTCEVQPPPNNPSPPSGAAGVALPVALDWDTPLPEWCDPPQYTLQHTVYFGATQDPPMVAGDVDPPYDPGSLLPGTTYYWRVHASTGVSAAMSQLWSFTTATSTPARLSTWGAIKALFR